MMGPTRNGKQMTVKEVKQEKVRSSERKTQKAAERCRDIAAKKRLKRGWNQYSIIEQKDGKK